MDSANVPYFIRYTYQSPHALAVIVALSTALFYDHALSIQQEVKHVWNAPWSYAKALFLVARYSAVFCAIFLLILINVLSPTLGPEVEKSCHIYVGILGLALLLFIAADLLFLLRVYALWNRSPKILWLGAITVLSQVMNVTICTLYFLEDNLPETTGGLLQSRISPLILIDWTFAVVYDTVLFILVLIKAAEHRMIYRVQSPLLYVYFRDGAGYYLVLVLLKALILIGCAVGNLALFEISVHIYVVLGTILSTRMYLNLRLAPGRYYVDPREGERVYSEMVFVR